MRFWRSAGVSTRSSECWKTGRRTLRSPFRWTPEGPCLCRSPRRGASDPAAKIELIIARAAAGVHFADAARDVQAYFAGRTRGLEVEVVSAEQMIAQMESQLGLMTILLGIIGSVSLIVGGYRSHEHHADVGG